MTIKNEKELDANGDGILGAATPTFNANGTWF